MQFTGKRIWRLALKDYSSDDTDFQTKLSLVSVSGSLSKLLGGTDFHGQDWNALVKQIGPALVLLYKQGSILDMLSVIVDVHHRITGESFTF
jgi:hypothetical protein